jgi:hypothetical protein
MSCQSLTMGAHQLRPRLEVQWGAADLRDHGLTVQELLLLDTGARSAAESEAALRQRQSRSRAVAEREV